MNKRWIKNGVFASDTIEDRRPNKVYILYDSLADISTSESFTFTLENSNQMTKEIRVLNITNS